MKKIIVLGLLLNILLFSSNSVAKVVRHQLAQSIEQREPIGDYAANVTVKAGELKKVFFFTQITDLANTQITHRWFYQGQEKAVVTLNIGSDNWRTYSSKMIPSYWSGTWQVQVWQEDKLLLSSEFTVTQEP
ncbi:DUF2914 domain-containing protein [Paraglaciecola sp. 25GB23A]|uniref:DUF2914 domain-containing protein n=1 Tax=Paraglaciecola sp. 25GB23A TaxID=3156068 RepID=UPI0032AECC25